LFKYKFLNKNLNKLKEFMIMGFYQDENQIMWTELQAYKQCLALPKDVNYLIIKKFKWKLMN